jgi:hydrogenase maturation protein HypF
VTGVVQGVGFRPFVYRLAVRLGLGGWARNDAGEVSIHVEGPVPALEHFRGALLAEAPPLARIEDLAAHPVEAEGFTDFRVLPSAAVDRTRQQPVPADVATCDACLAELFDPLSRRYRYPFITCTDCGPRFTVIDAVPYERDRTSMRAFQQCPECLREFETPSDRRFHSETNSCPVCGPRLWFEPGGPAGMAGGPAGRPTGGRNYEAALGAAAGLLANGGILAVRGLGGFHLAVDATDNAAVERLRARKHREAKPMAVMVRTLAEAARLGRVGPVEAALLGSPERPIVLLPVRVGEVAPAVHPGLDLIGIMLAYSPLHHLLLDVVERPLVMTSGNLSEEPIASSIDEARARLGGIADGFLFHDREILARADDSVVRPTASGPILIRRARGLAPLPLDLPIASPQSILAVGPHLKNTATLVRGRRAFVTPHIGDLETVETLEHFHHMVGAYRRLFHIDPQVVGRDLHPEYLSTRIAEESGLPVIAIQHHHAHTAAVLAERGRSDAVVGLAFDGTGYGDDGAVWGGEVLVADLLGYRRVAHLRYAPLPGGELAVRHGWRAALGYLSLEPAAASAFGLAFDGVGVREVEVARSQIANGVNSPMASSMGRLFDAAAAVLGVRRMAHYEGQAAMELEALAGRHAGEPLPFPVRADGEGWLLDPVPLLVALGDRRAAGREVTELAADFHASVAAASVLVARQVASRERLSTVALGGGVFQNARLLDLVRRGLERAGLEVLVPRLLGPNDGAISYGQAAICAARLATGDGFRSTVEVRCA